MTRERTRYGLCVREPLTLDPLIALEDAYLDPAAPKGIDSPVLRLSGLTETGRGVGFLRFDAGSLERSGVVAATLVLHTAADEPERAGSIDVFLASQMEWSESMLLAREAPALDALLDVIPGPFGPMTVASADVTLALSGEGPVSSLTFALQANIVGDAGVALQSSEAESPPELRLVTRPP